MDLVDEEDRVVGAAQLVEELLQTLLELAAELRSGDHGGEVQRKEPLVGNRVGDLAARDAQRQPLDDGTFAHARLADQNRIVLLAAREDLHDAFDFGVASDDGVDTSVASQPGKVGAELVEQSVFPGRAVFLVEIQQVGHRDFDVQAVARGEAAEPLGDGGGRDAVHLQHAGRDARTLFGDALQGVGRGDTLHLGERFEQFAGEVAVELFGRSVVGAARCVDFAFDAQAYLVEFPVPETGRKKLVGQGPLLAQQFERKPVLERAGDLGLGGVECRPGDDALQRL